MVRISPCSPITTPVPSRSSPRLALLRAPGVACAWTLTMAAKNLSASIGDGVEAVGFLGAAAATVRAMNIVASTDSIRRTAYRLEFSGFTITLPVDCTCRNHVAPDARRALQPATRDTQRPCQ